MKQSFSRDFRMDNRLKIILGIVVVSIFIFLTTVLVFVYALSPNPQSIPSFLYPFMEYHIQFMVAMGIFGILSGVLGYSLMKQTIEQQKKVVKTNTDIIFKFLAKEDREVLRLLLEKGGMTTQSEIAKANNMSRLRAHRAVRKLEERGIVHVERHGKINMIRLVDELRQQ